MTSWFFVFALLWAFVGFGLDFSERRLPNALNGVGVLLAASCLVVAGVACNQASAAQCIWGGVAGLLALLPFWLFRLMGAGDVKFFAVMGLIGGIWILPPVFLIGSMLAALMAVVFIAARSGRLAGYVPQPLVLWLQAQSERGLPFGAALALGFCVSLLAGLGQPERLAAWLVF